MVEEDSGTRLLSNGKYALTRILGEGAMGVVYAGTHTALGRPVAVKLLHPAMMRHAIHGQRFQREARTASKLKHRNAVQILDFGQDGADYFIVMEFINGQPLDDILGTEVRLGIDRALLVTSQVCAALQAAHDQGIVHRDIKPGNVIVSPAVDDDGRPTETVKVVDFGLAKLLASTEENGRQSLTMEGDVCGTPEYMAPEQAQGLPLDHRADIYSTGVMLYDMLVGDVPFRAESVIATMYQHVHAPPPIPSERNPRIPPELDAIILRALAKKPEDRWQSARAFRSALLGLPQADAARDQISDVALERLASSTVGYPGSPASVTERPGIGPSPALPDSDAKAGRRGRAWLPWALAAVGLLAAGGIGLALLSNPDPSEAPTRRNGVAVAGVTLPEAAPAVVIAPPIVAEVAPPPAETDATPTPDAEAAVESPAVVTAEPAVAEPAVAEPAVAEPAVAEPAVAEPAVAASAEPVPVPTRRVLRPKSQRRPVSSKPAPVKVDHQVTTPAPSKPAVVAAVAPSKPSPHVATEPAAVVTPTPPVHRPEPVAPTPEPKPDPVAPKRPPALAANAAFSGLSVNGALTRSAVDRVVTKTRGDLEACYRTAAQSAGHDAPAKITVRWVIDVDGRARDVRVSGRKGLAGLGPCVDRVFRRFRSRNRPDTGTVDASVIVSFTPRST